MGLDETRDTIAKAITQLMMENNALKKIDLKTLSEKHRRIIKERITRNESLILDYSFRLKTMK